MLGIHEQDKLHAQLYKPTACPHGIRVEWINSPNQNVGVHDHLKKFSTMKTTYIGTHLLAQKEACCKSEGNFYSPLA